MGFQEGNTYGRLAAGKPRRRRIDPPLVKAGDEPVRVPPFARMPVNIQLLHLEARHNGRGLIRDPAAYHSMCHGSAGQDHFHGEKPEMAESQSAGLSAPDGIDVPPEQEIHRKAPSRPIRKAPAAKFLPVPSEQSARSARSADIRFADVDSLGGFRVFDGQELPEWWGEGEMP
jgi:hypothetical protein